MISELTPEQMDHVLRTQVIGRIGCHLEGQIYVVPVTYVYDGAHLFGQSGPGMKVEFMRANPRVCFEVEQVENLSNWQCVIAWGNYEELEGEEASRAEALLVARLTPLVVHQEKQACPRWSGLSYLTDRILHRAGRHGVIFRIRIDSKTGRSEHP